MTSVPSVSGMEGFEPTAPSAYRRRPQNGARIVGELAFPSRAVILKRTRMRAAAGRRQSSASLGVIRASQDGERLAVREVAEPA